MFILPLEKSIDWNKPPLVTVFLLISNSLILFLSPNDGPSRLDWLMNYGFIPAEHRPLSFLTHMFMHGGAGHLIGNMVFLFLIGFAVETALGSLLYLAFYLLTGLCAVLLFWALNADSTIPLVGASGCVAGLMGLYSALFGLRKIRFFYSLLFYFGYASAPAIILLPAWVLNELYQLYSGADSHVAYVAHIGGLLGGGLLGLVVKRFEGKVDTRYLDESERARTRNQRFEEGINQLQSLDIDKAYATFHALWQEDPNDVEALLQLYKTAKFNPQSTRYQQAVEQVLRLPPNPRLSVKNLHDAVVDYRRSSPRSLPETLLIPLARRFCNGGFIDTAEAITRDLLATGSDEARAELLLGLALSLGRTGQKDKQRHYLSLLVETFPHHVSVNSARQMLAG